jgi:hypothetical protein
LTFKLNLVKPYREAFAGLFAKIFDPRAGQQERTDPWTVCRSFGLAAHLQLGKRLPAVK